MEQLILALEWGDQAENEGRTTFLFPPLPVPPTVRRREHLVDRQFGLIFIHTPTLRALRERTQAGRCRPCAPAPSVRRRSRSELPGIRAANRLRVRVRRPPRRPMHSRPLRGGVKVWRPPLPPLRYVLPLPDPAWSLEHYLNQFDADDRAALRVLYTMWHHVNETYFGGLLKPPFLSVRDGWEDDPFEGMEYDAPLGTCRSHPVLAGRVSIEIRYDLAMSVRDLTDPKACETRRWWRLTRDTLLHECIHQFHREVTGLEENHYGGHGPAFAAVCNRIGKKLGSKTVTYPRRSRMPVADCRFWPYPRNPERAYPKTFAELEEQALYAPWRGRRRFLRGVRRRAGINLPLPTSVADNCMSEGIGVLAAEFGVRHETIRAVVRQEAPAG